MTLKTELCGLALKNPLIMASGTFGFGEEFEPYIDPSKLGGICSKGLTLAPKDGNLGLRMWETPAGMLNSVGLQNPGVEHFIEEELETMRQYDTVVIANMGGGSAEDYLRGAELLDAADIDMLELNISCPNVKEGGIAFGIKAEVAHKLVGDVRKVYHGPLMVKLSPNAEDIVTMAQACQDAGADALSLINTLKGMAIDVYRRRPVFRGVSAGLSGPAIRPVALRMVYDVVAAVNIPVVGIGGIACARDVVEFIMAGATAVQIGTANFIRPDLSLNILSDLSAFMEQQKIEDLSEIRGCAQV